MAGVDTFVIIGAGLAGARAAAALRSEGFAGEVILIGAEAHRPYERPPLSKDVLRGESPVDKAYVHDENFYSENSIDLRTATSVVSISPKSHMLYLHRGEELGYDKLLLTTGSAPRRLSIPGSDLAGIHYLRAIGDMEALHGALSTPSKVVIVGAGWIGSEVAASARQMGNEVTVVDPGETPLAKVMGTEVGSIYKALHEEHGVTGLFNTGVVGFEGQERVTGVRLSDDSVIDADVVVVGIGAIPRVDLGPDAGLKIDNGIVVDEYLRTDDPDIFAAGDVASAYHPRYGRHIRVEHWSNAIHQGETAAKNMLGQQVVYDRLPYFYSDQYDLGMEYNGLATEWDRVVFRGDTAKREFLAFWLADDRVVAAMNANIWDVTDQLREIVEADRTIDPAKLADPDVALSEFHG